MGRPGDIGVWSNGLPNYPAGADPWSGTPVTNAPVYNYFTPNTPPAAQEINDLFNRQTQNQRDILDFLGQLPAQNFKGYLFAESYFTAVAWDPLVGTWGFGKSTAPGGTGFDYFETTLGNDEGNLSGGSSISTGVPFVAVAVGGDGNAGGPLAKIVFVEQQTAVAFNSSASSKIYAYDTVANTMALQTTISAPLTNGCLFNGLYILAGPYHDLTNPPVVYSSPDGTTWTSRSPTSVSTRFNTTHAWCGAASPTLAVFLPRAQSDGSGAFKMMSSPDGIAWTVSDVPVGGFQAVAWDDARQQFIAVSTVISSYLPTGTSTFWTSPDGVTWVSAATVTSRTFTGLAALGSLYAAISSTGDICTSQDGGLTWQLAGYLVDTEVTITGGVAAAIGTKYTRPQIYSNGQRLFVSAPSFLAFGMNAGSGRTVI